MGTSVRTLPRPHNFGNICFSHRMENFDHERKYKKIINETNSQADEVHLNFRVRSTFPVPVCTVSPGNWFNKAFTQ